VESFCSSDTDNSFGKKKVKMYIAPFLCHATTAVHLDLVDSLDGASLLSALQRFAAQRGCSKAITSDEGWNLLAIISQLDNSGFSITANCLVNEFLPVTM
jgi:hypothetical protein